MVEEINEMLSVKCLAQCLARGGSCHYSHLQVFVCAMESKRKTYGEWEEATGDRFQTPSEEDLPKGGSTTSGGGVPILGRRRAEVGWPLGTTLQSSGSHHDAGVAALALPGSLLEMQILVCFAPEVLNEKLRPVFYKLSR